MSSDSVGGTGAANSNQPRGGPQRHGERETQRKGEPDRDGEGKWEKETEVQCKKKAGAKAVRLRGRGRERSNIVDMDSTTAKAAGEEWANGKPPALCGVSCSHVVSPRLNLQNSKIKEMTGAKMRMGEGKGEAGRIEERREGGVKKKTRKTKHKKQSGESREDTSKESREEERREEIIKQEKREV